MSFFDPFKGDGKKKKNENPLKNVKNPFAQVGKAIGGKNRTFKGEGNSLGGTKPGKLLTNFVIENPGPVGVKIEKRPNESAIVSLVVEGSQADKAGVKRGDILCYAGTNGEEEIMYEQFLQLAAAKDRPLVFDVRRVESKSISSSDGASADAYARKQAMIAAAEAREKAHKQKMKTIPKGKETFKTRPNVPTTHQGSTAPMSEESRKAAEKAKAEEDLHAARLGYNPYETARATAGQARNATVAMTHGTIENRDGGKDTPAPNVPAPPPALPEAVSPEFEDAYTTFVSTNDEATAKSSIGVMCKLIVNATTKGQDTTDDAAKFRKVRLSNAKIKAAITDVNGGLDIMLAVGFQLMEEDGESFLVYPPGDHGFDWLPESLEEMQRFAKS